MAGTLHSLLGGIGLIVCGTGSGNMDLRKKVRDDLYNKTEPMFWHDQPIWFVNFVVRLVDGAAGALITTIRDSWDW